MVQINPSTSSFSVVANTTNSTTQVSTGQTSSYYTLLAREWAISPDLVQNTDYSSKYYATKSHEYADSILTNAGFIAVTESLTNINAVADDLTNINAVNSNKTNINTCANNINKISTCSSNITDIQTCSTYKNSISLVSGYINNVNNVSNNISSVNTVGSNIFNVNTCATYMSNINAVYADLTNIDSVAGDLTNIDTVAGNFADISTCSANIADINTCAANIPSLQDKANTAGDNFTIGGKSIIAKFVGLASNVKSAIPVGSSGFTYTANMTGFVFIQATGTTPNGFIYLVNDTTSIAFCNFAIASGYVIFAYVPVKSNDVIHVDYSGVTIDVANLIHSNIYQTTY